MSGITEIGLPGGKTRKNASLHKEKTGLTRSA
jgi:hypothetical protein